MQNAPADHVTSKGHDLLIALRAEAARLGLPNLEEASDDDLTRLLHVLPPDDHLDAEEEAVGKPYTKDQLLVTLIRVLITPNPN